MHIKQLCIQGFRSYKDQTLSDPFSPKHNVIVGKNGSGKSNFFAAIRFVLSDNFASMTREERQGLLHEGNGAATLTAYVELIFDNKDQRFPTGKEETVIRRSISLKKDEYFLDRKASTRTEVLGLLEAAGFSRSNPYYIVPQGRITSLTQSTDVERLNLLKEVAGTHVYDTRRKESLKIMQETEKKRKGIMETLKEMEKRIQELEREKAELEEWQELDRTKRSLEYILCAQEQSEVTRSLEDLDEERDAALSDMEAYQERQVELTESIMTMEEGIRRLQHDLVQLGDETTEAGEEVTKARRHLAQVYLQERENTLYESDHTKLMQECKASLAKLEAEVLDRRTELNDLEPEYETLRNLVQEVTQKWEKKEVLMKKLQERARRVEQFKTQEERNTWLSSRISETNKLLETQEEEVKQAEAETKNLEVRYSQEAEEARSMMNSLNEEQAKVDALSHRVREIRKEQDALTEERKSLWKKEAKASVELDRLREEKLQAEKILCGKMDRGTFLGVKRVMEMARSKGIEGCHGPLYGLIQLTSDKYAQAVEAAAGNSLFHVIVDTDATAARLLQELSLTTSSEKVRVTFEPLNRLAERNVSIPSYPDANDCIPLVRKLRWDQQFRPVIDRIFGGTIVCPSLEVASKYARSHGLSGMTLQGDRASRDGALTGGFHGGFGADAGILGGGGRLGAAKRLGDLDAQIEARDREVAGVAEALKELDQRMAILVSEGHRVEGQVRVLRRSLESIKSQYPETKAKEAATQATLESSRALEQSGREQVREMMHRVRMWEEEMSGPLDILSPEEWKSLRLLESEVESQGKEEVIRAQERLNRCKARKDELHQELGERLLPRQERLTLELKGMAGKSQERGEGERESESKDKGRAYWESMLKRARRRAKEAEGAEEQAREEERDLRRRLEETEQRCGKERRSMEEGEKRLVRLGAKRSVLLERKEQCLRRVRNLGVLPEEAYRKAEEAGEEDIEGRRKRLREVQARLQEWGPVNKRAIEQWGSFSRQKQDLQGRLEELGEAMGAIEDLVETLDARKDEAINRTFQEVAQAFTQTFPLLVPGGTGRLILRTGEGEGHFAGVGIKVAFNQGREQEVERGGMCELGQLSGGQRTVVALCLIFSIQQSDPAPFYLFDELDANLDAAYRSRVARLIEGMSQKAQIITTTFRPELVQEAEQCYGITFSHRVSRMSRVSQEEALAFVGED
ncbi:MAG: chromosome segregation protein sudA [Piptocephalis tieghemiana]|nr:MAG: chromosome segregation protein sudA [Piptocephalis tieghemiana]